MENIENKKELKWIPKSDYVKKYYKLYYDNSETIKCGCFASYKKVNMKKHLTSKRHLEYLNGCTNSTQTQTEQ